MLIDFHTHRDVAGGVVTPRCWGVHPWEADRVEVPAVDAEVWRRVDVVGECGVDRLRGPSMEVQLQVFERQIVIAERWRKPLVVHCVRALDEVMAMRRRHAAGRWVMHGFRGGVAMARQLMDKGIVLSVGAAVMGVHSEKLHEAMRVMGGGAFLLETDDSGVAIAEVYNATAAVLGVSRRQLEGDIAELYDSLFEH